jgi:hypothetical protein
MGCSHHCRAIFQMSNLGKLELLMQEQIPQVRGPASMNIHSLILLR